MESSIIFPGNMRERGKYKLLAATVTDANNIFAIVFFQFYFVVAVAVYKKRTWD